MLLARKYEVFREQKKRASTYPPGWQPRLNQLYVVLRLFRLLARIPAGWRLHPAEYTAIQCTSALVFMWRASGASRVGSNGLASLIVRVACAICDLMCPF